MHEINKSKPVLVTGGSGYVASWIVKLLLEEGLSVHATVRDPLDLVKVRHLKKIEKQSAGTLKLFKADLLQPGSFQEAIAGCELVFHTASPFFVTGIKNSEKELVQPALQGTENILQSVTNNGNVKRVVLTSSVAAIYGDNADCEFAPSGKFTEKLWNKTSSVRHQPYSYSKTVAERKAWSLAEEQDQWDLLTINPGWIFGPSVSQRIDSMSINTMIQFSDGTFKNGVPELWNGLVDVRDVAAAHLKAGYTPQASGRHILVSEEATLLQIAKVLEENFANDFAFPRRQVPKCIFWMIAPLLGYTRKYVNRNVGIPIRFDNSYSKQDLGMSYLPVARTIKDHFQQLIDDKLL